jgi:hypothetical protein
MLALSTMYCGIDVGLAPTARDHAAVCGVARFPSAAGAAIGDVVARADVAGLPFLDEDGAEPVFFFVGVVEEESDARPLPLLPPLPGGGGGEDPPAADILERFGQQEVVPRSIQGVLT